MYVSPFTCLSQKSSHMVVFPSQIKITNPIWLMDFRVYKPLFNANLEIFQTNSAISLSEAI